MFGELRIGRGQDDLKVQILEASSKEFKSLSYLGMSIEKSISVHPNLVKKRGEECR